MKIRAVFTLFFCVFLFISPSHVQSEENKPFKDQIIDSYHHGKAGNECSDIYFDYGINDWTFSEDDPDLLTSLHEACTTGKTDKATGQENLKKILENIDRGK
jgi:hypothetical protein